MVERINRAVSDCLVLCAYSTKALALVGLFPLIARYLARRAIGR